MVQYENCKIQFYLKAQRILRAKLVGYPESDLSQQPQNILKAAAPCYRGKLNLFMAAN